MQSLGVINGEPGRTEDAYLPSAEAQRDSFPRAQWRPSDPLCISLSCVFCL